MLEDVGLRVHRIISRLSREDGNPDEMSTLGEAAGRIVLLERLSADLIVLLIRVGMPPEHPTIQRAREIVGGR